MRPNALHLIQVYPLTGGRGYNKGFNSINLWQAARQDLNLLLFCDFCCKNAPGMENLHFHVTVQTASMLYITHESQHRNSSPLIYFLFYKQSIYSGNSKITSFPVSFLYTAVKVSNWKRKMNKLFACFFAKIACQIM